MAVVALESNWLVSTLALAAELKLPNCVSRSAGLSGIHEKRAGLRGDIAVTASAWIEAIGRV
jgi:hypothetical protein